MPDLSSTSFFAKRISPQVLPPPQTTLQKQGLAYERRVVRALKAKGFELDHNPWYEWRPDVCERFQKKTHHICCPDIVIYKFLGNYAIVVEVKLSATKAALEKLGDIYCPVVKAATGLQALPLIISKNLHRTATDEVFFNSDILTAVASSFPVYLWPGRGPIV